ATGPAGSAALRAGAGAGAVGTALPSSRIEAVARVTPGSAGAEAVPPESVAAGGSPAAAPPAARAAVRRTAAWARRLFRGTFTSCRLRLSAASPLSLSRGVSQATASIGSMHEIGTMRVKSGLAEMLKGGVIMDVVDAEQAKVAEAAGACAVMALERVPADIRRDGGVARMSDPEKIREIQEAVTIPVMA